MGVVGLTDGHPLSFKHLNEKNLDSKDLIKAKNLIKLFGGAPDSNNDDKLVTDVTQPVISATPHTPSGSLL